MLRHPTILVTGGAGFIGSAFVGQAVERGQKVIVLDALTYAGRRSNLEWIDPAGYELVVGNIADGPLVDSLLRKHSIDAIVHFAAESHVDNSISKPVAFIETNIVGSYVLLEAAREYWNELKGTKKEQFRFIHVSTDEVYGALGETGKFDENTPKKPSSPYSASKAASDHLAHAWFATYGLPTIITNCSNNYGPRQFPEKLIPLTITNALAGKPLPVYGNGSNIRDWIHVEDHCDGVALALGKGIPGETYCFGGNSERRNIEVVNQICRILDRLRPAKSGASYASQITFVRDRLGHDYRYAIDDTKAQQQLGFRRKYDFEAGLESTVEWYLHEYALA
ncbi:MAG TPA: dTDP-glucose 4,6-dehydratase [Rickettsiales bacterium]|nr:dTDP-glucose 4,6-dehydratase [Rickettsiales bacterium]